MLGQDFRFKNLLTLKREWTPALLCQSLLKFQRMRHSTNQSQSRFQAKFSNSMMRNRALISCSKIGNASEQIFMNSCQNEQRSTYSAQSARRVTILFPAFQKIRLGTDRLSLMIILLLLSRAKHQA